MSTNRKNPETLLHQVQNEERKEKRGKLKIYLGAAPGVGKTYEMLHDASNIRAKGLDVVVGIAESHGRHDIEAMLNPFEILPRKIIYYRGKKLLELDLDAVLKRNPGLILVDEMAHTNAPGMRHNKRWQDIKELLDRGIDVYTTLNVQHIESLNDDVAQIIQAPIHETVPDFMIEMADKVELIDLPPEDLLQRLREGKVYLPAQAEVAIEHFFRKGNLIALRELALRITAERVNAEILTYRQGEGIKLIWPVQDKILVCVGPRHTSLKLIRAAKRFASSLQATWLAVYVDLPTDSAAEQKRIDAISHLRLAEQLGAETHILTGFDVVKEIMEFAREKNITQIMIRKNIHARGFNWLYRNLADDIVRQSGEIDVYIITGESLVPKTHKKSLLTHASTWVVYAITFGTVALATLVNFMIASILPPSNVIMVFFLAIIGIAFLGQIGASLIASLLCIFSYDFFFTPPTNTFTTNNIADMSTLLMLFIVTQIVSQLVILTRRQTKTARLIQLQTTALYAFSRKLTKTRGVTRLLQAGTEFIAQTFDSEVLSLLPQNNRLEIQTSSQFIQKLTTKEYSIAEWVFEQEQMAGLGTDTLSFSSALFIPLFTAQGAIGVLRISPKNKQIFSQEQRHLLASCVNQLALALNVDRLQEKENKKEIKIQSDRVQGALLQAISYNLRMPLTSVIRTVKQYLELESTTITDQGIHDEISKLNRLNNNILQITQLEKQTVSLQKEPSSIINVIKEALHKYSQLLKDRTVQLNANEDIPIISLNRKLIQDVLINLIDNAIKFTPTHSPITIAVSNESDKMVVSVEDCGPGISSDEINKLFKKFYRSKTFLTQPGLGLGLAICQKIIEAHGGSIWVENISTGGATFRFSLPFHDE